jgi:pantothenate kinase-related protein Tda10
MWKIILIETIVIVVLIAIVFFMSKMFRSLQEEKNRLEVELSKQKSNVVYLYRNAQEIAKIAKSEKKMSEEIKDAKTDEEIFNVVNTILNLNNSRVCK